MRFGLIGAMAEEVELLRKNLNGVEETEAGGAHFYHGTLAGAEAVLLRSGIGKVNAAIGATLLIDRFWPDAIINTGSAGGTDPSLDIGDVVISSGVRYHDVDATAFNYAPGQVPGMPAIFRPDAQLAATAKRAAEATSDRRIVSGEIGTGDSFMADPERIAALRRIFPNVKAVEMEGAAIAQVCDQFGVPFLVVRALSDIAGKDSEISFDRFLHTAAKRSARFVIELVKELAKA